MPRLCGSICGSGLMERRGSSWKLKPHSMCDVAFSALGTLIVDVCIVEVLSQVANQIHTCITSTWLLLVGISRMSPDWSVMSVVSL